jgi:hypothetical protein
MNRPVLAIIAPCSGPSRPLRAAFGGGLRPVVTAPVRGAFRNHGRDGETALNRTEKHCLTKATPNLQNLTHTTRRALDTVNPASPRLS